MVFTQNFLQARSNGLASTHNGLNPNNTVEDPGNAAAEIGGVGLHPGEIPGLGNSLAHTFDHNHLFLVPHTGEKAPFTQAQLNQIFRELTAGIYVHDVQPWFSLHFNNDLSLYPVIPPQYENTLVGKVIGMLDYYMKGFLNGGFFDEKYIQEWLARENKDNSNDIDQATRFEDYIKQHLGEDTEYYPLRTIYAMMGIAPATSEELTQYNSSFRIISEPDFQTSDNTFQFKTRFRVGYTIEGAPDYDKFLKEHKHRKGEYPDDHKKLIEAHEFMAAQIKQIMPKWPICRELFGMLGAIQFFASYLTTQKNLNKAPVLPPVATNKCVFPPLLPPLPLAQAGEEKVAISMGELLDAAGDECTNQLANLMRKAVIREEGGPFTHVSLGRNVLADAAKGLQGLLRKKASDPAFAQGIGTQRMRTLAAQMLDNFIDQAIPLAQEAMVQKAEFLENARAVIDRNNRNRDDQLRQLNELLAQHGLPDMPSEMRAEVDKFKEDIENRNREIERAVEEANGHLEELINVRHAGFRRLGWECPVMVKQFVLLSTNKDERKNAIENGDKAVDQFRSYRVMGGCGVSFDKVERQPLRDNAVAIQGWDSLRVEDSLALKQVSAGGQQYSAFRLDLGTYQVSNDVDYLSLQNLLEDDSRAAPSQKFSEIAQCIFSGDFEQAKTLLKPKPGKLRNKVVDEADVHGQTLMHYAATIEDPAFMAAVVRAGGKIDACDEHGQTPLHMAVMHDNKRVVSWLLEKDASLLSALKKNNNNVFHVAGLHDAYDSMRVLGRFVAPDTQLGNMCNTSGMTPLHLAVFHGAEKTALWLMEQTWVNVNEENSAGSTALHIAIAKGDAKLARALVERGAGLSIQRRDKAYPVHIACAQGDDALAAYIVEATKKAHPNLLAEGLSSQATPLHLAAGQGLQKTVEALSVTPELVNKVDWQGRTPIMYAIEACEVGVANYLAQNPNLEVDQTDNLGRSALWHSAADRQWEVVNTMIARGAKATKADPITGSTAMHLMASHDFQNSLAYLYNKPMLRTTKNLNRKDNGKRTVGDIALERGAIHSYDWMFDPSGPIKMTPSRRADGMDLIHFYAAAGDVPNVKKILEAAQGAPFLINKAGSKHLGKSAAYFAAERGFAPLVELLNYPHSNRCDDNHRPLLEAALRSKDPATIDAAIGADNANVVLDRQKNTAAHMIARTGDLGLLEFMVSRGLDVSVRNAAGESALSLAIRGQHQAMITYLLKKVVPNSLDICEMVRFGSVKDVEDLLQKKWKPAPRPFPLFAAIERNDAHMLSALLAAGFNRNTVGMQHALAKAVQKQQLASAEVLLRAGADANQLLNGKSFLQSAIKGSDLRMIELLLNNGANPNIRNQKGETASEYAARRYRGKKGHLSVIQSAIRGESSRAIRTATEIVKRVERFVTGKEQKQLIDLGLAFGVPNASGQYSPMGHHLLKADKLDYVDRLSKSDLLARDNEGCNLIHLAAALKRIDILERAKQLNIPMATSLFDGPAPLIHFAVKAGAETLNFIVNEIGCDVNAQDRHGNTALMYAVEQKSVEAVDALLKLGANPNISNAGGVSPIGKAIEAEQPHLASMLFNNKRFDVDVQHGAAGVSLAGVVASNGDTTLMRELSHKGVLAQLRKYDHKGLLPIHRAIALGHLNMIKLLCQLDPKSLYLKTLGGENYLHLAVTSRKLEVLEFLLQQPTSEDDVNDGISIQPDAMLPQDDKPLFAGETPLHLAMAMGNYQMGELLYQYGADIMAKSDQELLPIDMAAMSGNWDALSWLTASGQFSAEEIKQKIAQNALSASPSSDIVSELLVQNQVTGFSVNSLLGNGRSAVYYAANNPRSAAPLVHLLQRGASVDFGGGKGESPIMAAVEVGSIDNVTALLDWGANPNSCDSKGETLLNRAVLDGNYALMALLLSRGADGRIKGANSRNAIELALQNGHQKMAELLLAVHGARGVETNGLSEGAASFLEKFQSFELLCTRAKDSLMHKAARLDNVDLLRVAEALGESFKENGAGVTPIGLTNDAQCLAYFASLNFQGNENDKRVPSAHKRPVRFSAFRR